MNGKGCFAHECQTVMGHGFSWLTMHIRHLHKSTKTNTLTERNSRRTRSQGVGSNEELLPHKDELEMASSKQLPLHQTQQGVAICAYF